MLSPLFFSLWLSPYPFLLELVFFKKAFYMILRYSQIWESPAVKVEPCHVEGLITVVLFA